jgi:hypothetical protein
MAIDNERTRVLASLRDHWKARTVQSWVSVLLSRGRSWNGTSSTAPTMIWQSGGGFEPDWGKR